MAGLLCAIGQLFMVLGGGSMMHKGGGWGGGGSHQPVVMDLVLHDAAIATG